VTVAGQLNRSMRVRTRLDPEIRREQIVAAAALVFEGRDPADVTFEEIADAAGVSRALVYNYFGDRGGLLAAVYLRAFQRLDDEITAAVDASLPAPQRVREIVRSYLRFARTHSGAWQLLGLAGTLQHPAVHAARRRRLAQLADGWGGSPASLVVASGVVGMLEAATLRWLDHDPEIDLDTAAAVLYDLLWTGLSSLSAHGITIPDHAGV
jgi:AcrR family transcriptional regulator